MALDPSISLKIIPPTFQAQDPMEVMGRALSLRHMMQQGLLQQQQMQQQQVAMQGEQLKLEQARRDAADRQRLSEYLSGLSGGGSPQQPVPNAPAGVSTDGAAAAIPNVAPGVTSTAPAGIQRPLGMPDIDYSKVMQFGNVGATFLKNVHQMNKDRFEDADNNLKLLEAKTKAMATLAAGVTKESDVLPAVATAYQNQWITSRQRDELLSHPYDPKDWSGFQYQALDANQRLADKRAEQKQLWDQWEHEHNVRMAGPQEEEAASKNRLAQLREFAIIAPGLKNQDQWDTAIGKLPEAAQKLIPKTYSGAAVEQVQQFGIPPEERQRLKIQQEGERIKQFQADPFGLFGIAPGGTGTSAAPAAAGPSALAQAISDFEGFGKKGSVAERNNNPGNLRSGPGMTGLDANGYAVFPDVQTGWNALQGLIDKRSGQDLTLQEFIGGKPGVYNGYAPAADKNDPAQYASFLANKLGVQPNAKLGEVTAAGATPQPGLRVSADMTGDDLLNALPKPISVRIKAIAEGRETPPSGFSSRSPQNQALMSLVEQYDPTFDAANPKKRASTAIDFASGTSARQVNSLNTVIGHLETFGQAADKLHNTWLTPYNSLKNLIAAKTGDADITKFETARKAVVDELTRVWRGTGGSEADIKSWADALDSAGSPAQLHGAIHQIGELLNSKLSSLEAQYKQGMGRVGEGIQLLTPESRVALDRLEQRAAGTTPTAAKAAAPAKIGEAPSKAPAGFTVMKAPNGQTKVVPNADVAHYKSLGAVEVP